MSSLTLLFAANFWLVSLVQDPAPVADPTPVVAEKSAQENTEKSDAGTVKSVGQEQPTLLLDVANVTTQEGLRFEAGSAIEGFYLAVADSDILYTPNRTQFGVHVRRADDTLRKHLKIKSGIGLVVESVVPESGAAAAGVQIDDVLLKLDEQWLVNSEQFTTLVQNSEVGQTAKVTLVREGLSQELLVTLMAGTTQAEDVQMSFSLSLSPLVAQGESTGTSHVEGVEMSNLDVRFAPIPADDFHKDLPEASNCSACHRSNSGQRALWIMQGKIEPAVKATTESVETQDKK